MNQSNLCNAVIISLIPLMVLAYVSHTHIFSDSYPDLFESYGVYERLSDWDVDAVHNAVMLYLADRTQSIENSNGFFNAREIAHFADVKQLMQLLFTLGQLFFIIMLIHVVVLFCQLRHTPTVLLHFSTILKRGSIVTLACVAVIGILVASSFSSFFLAFHEIFFAEGTYLFDIETERIIQLYPYQLFFDKSVAVVVSLILSSMVLWIVGFVLSQKFASKSIAK